MGRTGKLLAVGPDKVLSLRRVKSKDKDAKDVDAGCLSLVNIRTGEVEYVEALSGRVFSGMTSVDLKREDARFCTGPDGCGWLFIDGWLTRIHPSDGRVEKIMAMKQRGRMFFVGDDLYIYNGGREYFNGFAGILRVSSVFAR